MPSGVPICRLRASARRTSGNGSGGSPSGWPSPTSLSPATADYNAAGDSCNLRKTKWVHSMRSRENGVDVSAIAKAHGGGGHAHAAGFNAAGLQAEVGRRDLGVVVLR